MPALNRFSRSRTCNTAGRPAAGGARFLRAIHAIEARFRRARPGSVLILVVALLVLMALIGTAFISTTGFDREAATQHSYNTQIDLLVEGIRDAVVAQIVGALRTEADYREMPPLPRAVERTATKDTLGDRGTAQYFENVDWLRFNEFQASRLPGRSATFANGYGYTWVGPASTGTIAWDAISASPLAVSGTNQFESPRKDDPSYNTRRFMEPRGVDVKSPGGVTRQYPAFRLLDTADPEAGDTVLAADTDGDGIADGGLFKIPIGQINGVTYYASVRAIDHGSAINTSIAMYPNRSVSDETAAYPADSPSGDFFPTNVDLYSLLVAGAPGTEDWTRLNNYRFNRSDLTVLGNWPKPIDDNTKDERDPTWTSIQEAAWAQLGRRLEYPGWIVKNGTNPSKDAYRALAAGDLAALAYHFVVADASGSTSSIETALKNTIGTTGTTPGSVPSKAFAPDKAATWYTQLFDYEQEPSNNAAGTGTRHSPRPILTVRNPVSNMIPVVYGGAYVDRDTTFSPTPWFWDYMQGYVAHANAPAEYRAGDMYTVGGRTYVCLADGPLTTYSGTPVTPNATGSNSRVWWAQMPFTSHPTKINPNVATFEQLYAGFSAVMADALYFGGNSDPRQGTFRGALRYPNVPLDTRPTAYPANDLVPPEVMLRIRAALAAVNTIDLRDPDRDVTSRTIVVPFAKGNHYEVNVYGTERQPFITECIVHVATTGIPDNYVAIELFNPFDEELVIPKWKLAVANRVTAMSDLELEEIAVPDTERPKMVIPANSSIVLESSKDKRQLHNIQLNGATFIEVGQELAGKLMTNGSEFYLMRPRRYDGDLTKGKNTNNVENIFDESTTNTKALIDMVPADQLDFYQIDATYQFDFDTSDANPAKQNVSARYHYRRANSETNGTNRWHCVYAGKFTNATALTDPKKKQLEGWRQDDDPDDPLETVTHWTPGALGLKKDVKSSEPPGDTMATYETRTVQIAKTAGPNDSNQKFPFGGFARTGDLLQVPFIGGYRIRRLTSDTIPVPADNTLRAGGNTLELHAVSMDCSFANADATSGIDVNEQLGRFCPIDKGAPPVTDDFSLPDDDDPKPSPGTPGTDDPPYNLPVNPPATWRYRWAMDLFDFFSVQSPQDDYLPDVDPNHDNTVLSGTAPKWSGAAPDPVQNTAVSITGGPNNGTEDIAPIEGLVNVNTADWLVLSKVPLIPRSLTVYPRTAAGEAQWAAKNADLAKAIVWWRDVNGDPSVPTNDATRYVPHGPFRNLFELEKVVDLRHTAEGTGATNGFKNGMGTIPSTGDPNTTHGDLSPLNGADNVPNDFEAHHLMLTRASNLLTTRSDAFTVYVLVQGWRYAGTANPELVVQRRVGLYVDRSTVSSNKSSTPRTIMLPQ